MKIWRKVEEFLGCKFLVVRRDGSVPNWPYFVLGARDPYASHALRAYALACRNGGLDSEYCDSIEELAVEFENYRNEHGIGDPDAKPHRTDNPDVVSVMCGKEATISVKPE